MEEFTATAEHLERMAVLESGISTAHLEKPKCPERRVLAAVLEGTSLVGQCFLVEKAELR